MDPSGEGEFGRIPEQVRVPERDPKDVQAERFYINLKSQEGGITPSKYAEGIERLVETGVPVRNHDWTQGRYFPHKQQVGARTMLFTGPDGGYGAIALNEAMQLAEPTFKMDPANPQTPQTVTWNINYINFANPRDTQPDLPPSVREQGIKAITRIKLTDQQMRKTRQALHETEKPPEPSKPSGLRGIFRRQ